MQIQFFPSRSLALVSEKFNLKKYTHKKKLCIPSGFGDFVPSRPLYMMASIFYLIFGLALTSMCINVVQVKLSDHFKTASSKIIGLQIAEATSQNSAPHSPTSDLQSVHSIDNSGVSAQLKQQPPLQPSVIISDNNTKNTNSKML